MWLQRDVDLDTISAVAPLFQWMEQAFSWVANGDFVCIHWCRQKALESDESVARRAWCLHAEDVELCNRQVHTNTSGTIELAGSWYESLINGSLCSHRHTSLSWIPSLHQTHTMIVECTSMSFLEDHRGLNYEDTLQMLYCALESNHGEHRSTVVFRGNGIPFLNPSFCHGCQRWKLPSVVMTHTGSTPEWVCSSCLATMKTIDRFDKHFPKKTKAPSISTVWNVSADSRRKILSCGGNGLPYI